MTGMSKPLATTSHLSFPYVYIEIRQAKKESLFGRLVMTFMK